MSGAPTVVCTHPRSKRNVGIRPSSSARGADSTRIDVHPSTRQDVENPPPRSRVYAIGCRSPDFHTGNRIDVQWNRGAFGIHTLHPCNFTPASQKLSQGFSRAIGHFMARLGHKGLGLLIHACLQTGGSWLHGRLECTAPGTARGFQACRLLA